MFSKKESPGHRRLSLQVSENMWQLSSRQEMRGSFSAGSAASLGVLRGTPAGSEIWSLKAF